MGEIGVEFAPSLPAQAFEGNCAVQVVREPVALVGFNDDVPAKQFVLSKLLLGKPVDSTEVRENLEKD